MGLKQFQGDALYNCRYGEVPPEGGTFQLYERAVTISLVEVKKIYGREICLF